MLRLAHFARKNSKCVTRKVDGFLLAKMVARTIAKGRTESKK